MRRSIANFSSQWTYLVICTFGVVGMTLASGCKTPSQGIGGGTPPQAQYQSPPRSIPQSIVAGSQGYPTVSRSGGAPQRGIDGAPAFGAGPGGSGIMPR